MTLEVEIAHSVYRGEDVKTYKFDVPEKTGFIAIPQISSDLMPFMNRTTWHVNCQNVIRTVAPHGVVYYGDIVGQNGEKAKFKLYAN